MRPRRCARAGVIGLVVRADEKPPGGIESDTKAAGKGEQDKDHPDQQHRHVVSVGEPLGDSGQRSDPHGGGRAPE